MSIRQKIACITGGSRGVGFATAKLFLSHGARVAICSRNKEELQTAESLLRTQFSDAEILAKSVDLSHENEVEDFFSSIHSKFGGCDILVNNAAILHICSVESMKVSDFDDTYRVNVKAPFLCSQHVFKLMKNTGGSIVNVSSLSGIKGVQKFPGFTSYVTSKFAVVGLTESLAVEGKPYHIRVNCIAPGAIETKMLTQVSQDIKTNTKPEHIAETILYLSDNDRSGHITGSTMELFTNE